MTAFYTRDGDAFIPTPLAASPWEPGRQNGVALGGLLAQLIETMQPPGSMQVARITIDILCAVPFAPIHGQVQVMRDGSRLQHVQSQLTVDGRLVARANAIRVRLAATPTILPPNPYLAPEAAPAYLPAGLRPFGAATAAWLGRAEARSPAKRQLWLRLLEPHVDGIPLSPLVKAVAVADLGNGVGRVLPFAEWLFPNVDISVHFSRYPVGDWILIDARTETAGNGWGMVHAVLADISGPFAMVHQTLFIAARDPAPDVLRAVSVQTDFP